MTLFAMVLGMCAHSENECVEGVNYYKLMLEQDYTTFWEEHEKRSRFSHTVDGKVSNEFK